jgi:hypothetical protein
MFDPTQRIALEGQRPERPHLRAACGGLLELAMKATELKEWLSSVARLTPRPKVDLLKTLGAGADEAHVRWLVGSRTTTLPAWVHCGCDHIVGSGSGSSVQRRKSRTCANTFKASISMPLARLRLRSGGADGPSRRSFAPIGDRPATTFDACRPK